MCKLFFESDLIFVCIYIYEIQTQEWIQDLDFNVRQISNKLKKHFYATHVQLQYLYQISSQCQYELTRTSYHQCYAIHGKRKI